MQYADINIQNSKVWDTHGIKELGLVQCLRTHSLLYFLTVKYTALHIIVVCYLCEYVYVFSNYNIYEIRESHLSITPVTSTVLCTEYTLK